MVQLVSGWLPIPQEVMDDAEGMRWMIEAMPESREPRDTTETETGWRDFTASNGISGQIAVGWRYEQQRRESDAEREAEMAACSYVACTCGWHEDD